jgi:outer membrane protein OmpA-like peptidoglycan-associated protein
LGSNRKNFLESLAGDMLNRTSLRRNSQKFHSKLLTTAGQIKSEGKQMKRVLFSVIFTVLVFTATSALAANAYNWTGVYLGLQGMYGHGETKWEYVDNGQRNDHTINGFMGGLLLGYNYQFPINVVVGVETDFNYGKIYGSANNPHNIFWLYSTDVDWVGSTRIRAGYAIWRFLPYVGAGVAYGHASIYTTNIPPGALHGDYGESNTYFGWTPSAGLEFAVTKNLLARAEYSYYDFGKKHSYVDFPALSGPVESTINFDGFKLALMWKFGGAKEAPEPIAKAAAEPPPPPVEKKIMEKGRATMDVEFDTGKAIVKPAYYKEIEAVADVMKKYPDLKIVVEGHTDNVGGEKYNLNLSQKRAEAIKAVMVQKFNIEASRITAKGFGFSNPIADNSTKEGRQQNRRVEAAVEYTVKK